MADEGGEAAPCTPSEGMPLRAASGPGERYGTQVTFDSEAITSPDGQTQAQLLRTFSGATLRRIRSSFTVAKRWANVYGPGMVVMLADVDAGSLVTAAESGREFGYSLCWINVMLILPLFLVQELTVRVGAVTGTGFVEAIRKRLGKVPAALIALFLTMSSGGALVSEITGVMGVAQVAGFPAWVACLTMAAVLIAVTAKSSHDQLENIALTFGVCQAMFFVTAALTFPPVQDLLTDSWPIRNPGYRRIVAANLGAVVMPWMINYQQSSIAEKKLTWKDVHSSRKETLLGAVFSQLLMGAIVLTAAAQPAGVRARSGRGFSTVPGLATALGESMGVSGIVLCCCGVIGASLIGAIVASVAAIWAVSEVFAQRAIGTDASRTDTAETRARHNVYVGLYAALVGAATIVTLLGLDAVQLNVAVQVMNCLFAPMMLGLLFWLASTLPDRRTPGDRFRLCGVEKWLYGLCFVCTSAVSIAMPLSGSVSS